MTIADRQRHDPAEQETQDWIESLQDVLDLDGPARVSELLGVLQLHAQHEHVHIPVNSRTPYVNSIAPEDEPAYPGDRALERRIKSLVRWNAMAMVVRANRESAGIGGHISTFASSATLYEVGLNHFFRGKDHASGGDHVYYQGHAAPGIYARAYLEGRLSLEQISNFRRELDPQGGLSSYPHPWLMPDFWEYPTVSMGLGPIQALYRARFLRYLENRGLKPQTGEKVWAFLGDGECDEPESLGSISMAARKKLDNLVFVVNCNLQRLDGPVRGNGQIVQELEAVFRGVGWKVIKVLWGSDWDPFFEKDESGLLVRTLGQVLDGERQKYRVEGGAYIREKFWARHPDLLAMVRHLSDDDLTHMRLGGHDPQKVHAAFREAVETKGQPVCILAHTIKGYGLGEAGEGKNITHQQKKMNEEELLRFRDRFDIPVSDDEVGDAPFYRPPQDSPEIQYLLERRRELGGFVPTRTTVQSNLPTPGDEVFGEFAEGTGKREVSTTMVMVRMLADLLKDERVGKHIVPIIPDEARTFGMEPLFRQVGIYSGVGQLYEPVDSDSLLYYRQAKDGQILEEGITEAGAMSSFIAAGTSHAAHGTPMIPIFLFYSMFGLQRVGDLVWAAGDMRCRGFLMGATAGRTTLAGEGLQHQDGNSHVLALPCPTLQAYDPAYAYELAEILRDGMRRMYFEDEDVFYYVTIGNENYVQPPMPAGAQEGIVRGLYRFREGGAGGERVQLFGSGSILNEAVKAQELLSERFGIEADVWSVTSYKRLREEAHACERWNAFHPAEAPRRSWLEQSLEGVSGPIVAASDYLKVLPDSIARWLPGRLVSLGTDGFGRSEDRARLRDFFEVDARHIALGAITALLRDGKVDVSLAQRALTELEIDPERADPFVS